MRNAAGDNPYARPIANLHPVVDLRRRKVMRVDDFGVVPLPPEGTPSMSERHAHRREAARHRPARRAEFHRRGPTWCAGRNGSSVVGFHVRDGLILHMIGYEDEGRLRPIMHRASMAEMVVPYGDPTGAEPTGATPLIPANMASGSSSIR